jgi:2-haloalkanoic acid dehalogenase type II
MSALRYLTFDCYGTLIDWRKGIEASLGAALGVQAGGGLLAAYIEAEKREELAYKKYRKVLGDAATKVAAGLGVALGPKKAEEFAASVPAWPSFADTRESLAELKEKGYGLYILSNVDRDLLEETVRRHSLAVDGWVTAEDTRSYKPSPEHWKAFMRSHGAERAEILHVAQSLFHDIAPTQGMGIASAWINRYGERLPPGLRPEYIADGLKPLADLLPRSPD